MQRRDTKMKKVLKYSVIPAIALAFATSTPASAQLLGGGGGLGGGVGGGLGGDLTGSIQRTTGSITSRSTGSVQGEKQVDRKSGRVRGSGSAQGSSNGSIAGGTTLMDRPVMGDANGSANASKSGSVDAQLIGTDTVRSLGQDGVGRARSVVDNVRSTAGSAAGSAGSATNNAASMASGIGTLSGAAAGNGSAMGQGMASGGLGQLAAAGSSAANGAGMFAIESGMPIEDPKGRVIGYVQQVKQTKQGVIQAVTVEVGDRVATLPAANFSGSGEALVTGMTKAELKSAANDQEASPQGANSNSRSNPIPPSNRTRQLDAISNER
jgi:hypothetical protein